MYPLYPAVAPPLLNNEEKKPENIKQIQIVFSKPMNEKISINFSKFGKEHFPLKKNVGLDETKTILTIENKPHFIRKFDVFDNYYF